MEWISFVIFCSGLLRELGPLLHRAEPAAPPHRGPLHPPAAAGLAHPRRHQDGAADVHEQVQLTGARPAFPPLSICYHANLLLAKKERRGQGSNNDRCAHCTSLSLEGVCLFSQICGQVDVFEALFICTNKLF